MMFSRWFLISEGFQCNRKEIGVADSDKSY